MSTYEEAMNVNRELTKELAKKDEKLSKLRKSLAISGENERMMKRTLCKFIDGSIPIETYVLEVNLQAHRVLSKLTKWR